MTARSTDNLQELLKEQISFLRLSCNSYDKGFLGESKRIATIVRVLVHDTKNSHSLLKQLNIKNNIDFFSSACKFNPSNIASHTGLVLMRIEMINGETEYLPFLDDALPDSGYMYDFNEWWSEIVIKDKNQNLFTRKDLILSVCNKEGGTHVDPKLDPKFENLLKNNSINWYITSDSKIRPFGKENTQLIMASIRQIGYEVQKTLEPYLH